MCHGIVSCEVSCIDHGLCNLGLVVKIVGGWGLTEVVLWLRFLVVAPPPRWYHFHCNIKCFGGTSFQLVVDIMVVELLGLV